MKVLRSQDLTPEDSLLLTFHGTFDPRVALEDELGPFLQALEQYAGGWMPDVVKGKRQRKYSRAAFWKALEEQRDENSTSIGLYRTTWPALDIWPSLHFPPLAPTLTVFLEVQPLSFFAEAERCHAFVEMVRAWASRYPASHAAAHSVADRGLMDSPNFGRDDETQRRDGFDKVYEVSWLNVFGSKLVESVGRERVLSTPAHRVEELPDGSVLLVTWPTAADFASPEAREAQALAHLHLRPDLDPSTLRLTLRERSATLAPVAPRFPPDLAPLLSRVVDAASIHERQRRIAELNAWHPPEPKEWLPPHAALPSDDEPEPALKLYATLAEHLVALLHVDVPSVFDATPESLTDIDFYLWHADFPTRRPRQALDEQLVYFLGAYLGQVLVHHLGGQWLPRRQVLESQVRVGPRVWRPFARAWRALRSRQSLLDFSLTHLYREAARHRA